MPSTSPGLRSKTAFTQILPGAPTSSLQSTTTFFYRHKRYIAYLSCPSQLALLSSPTTIVQALTFKEQVTAVLADEGTGRLAVACGKGGVYVLEPVVEGWTSVRWEKRLKLVCRLDEGREDDEARCLSWGTEGEVLVGGERGMALFGTVPKSRSTSPAFVATYEGSDAGLEERKAIWSKPVASPCNFVALSPNGDLIATAGVYDRLVKIWRRLSFEEALFDYSYLPHGAGNVVTHLEWRPQNAQPDLEERRSSGISGRHEEDPEVLYTIATDGVLRVWRTGGLHDLEIVVLWATVDLVGAIPLSSTLNAGGKGEGTVMRHACILPSDWFGSAVAASLSKQQDKGMISHSLEHLKEVMTKTPDVVLTLDGQGRMSAWGLQSIGHKRRPETPGAKQPFHIAHAEDMELAIAAKTNVVLHAWFEEDEFNLLVHGFDGKIGWWKGDVETFFSPAASGMERMGLVAEWQGHGGVIEEAQAIDGGAALLSTGAAGESVLWAPSGLDGRLECVSTKSGHQQEQRTHSRIAFETDIANPSLFASNSEFVALVSPDREELVIHEVEEGYVEHRQHLTDPVQHLAIFSSAPGHNFLAVGYDDYVDVLVQDRYKQRHEHAASWILVKTVSIAGVGLHINDVAWLKDGRLVLAAGNGLFISDNEVVTTGLHVEVQETLDLDAEKDKTVAMSVLARRLRLHLPVWHPGLLTHLVNHGKASSAIGLVHKLLAKLRFWSEGDELRTFLDANAEDVLDTSQNQTVSTSSYIAVEELLEQLGEKHLPALSTVDQTRLKRVVKTLRYISEHIHALDSSALRYLSSWKLHLLQLEDDAASSVNLTSPNTTTDLVPQMHWREIAFASHSTTQQPLLDILTTHYSPNLTWPIARALGLTAWIAEPTALATVFEALAQSAYRATNPPNPINASLYFLALNKKITLSGLWRIATWHKEQRATLQFLKRDFEGKEARTAAKKNAYALMGKRRFEYAAAFFLLADDVSSAIGILVSQCEDVMLAVAVARLYGGASGLETLITGRLLPRAVGEGNRWYTSWCHSRLDQREQAARALIVPLRGVRLWWQDDPLALLLYRQLRGRGEQSPPEEYAAVLRAAKILRRMGLGVLALDLVRVWEFRHKGFASSTTTVVVEGDVERATNGVRAEPAAEGTPSLLDSFTAPTPPSTRESPSLLDMFSSKAPPPVLDEKAAREAKAAELLAKLNAKRNSPQTEVEEVVNGNEKKREPTQFKEPDANSLLDSFGF